MELCNLCVILTGVKGADVKAMKEAINRNDEAAIAEISRRGVLPNGSAEVRAAHMAECHRESDTKPRGGFNAYGSLRPKGEPMVEWGNPRKK